MKQYFDYWRDEIEYFRKYTYSNPLIISDSTNNDFEFIQKALYKTINHFVKNYKNFANLMPLNKDTLRLLKLTKDIPYEVGTYRTDFIINQNNKIKLIEITCRFALNGYIRSGLFHKIGDDLILNLTENLHNNYTQLYLKFIKDFRNKIKSYSKIIVLGNSKQEEGKFIEKMCNIYTINFEIIPFDEIENKLHEFKNCLIIPQLSHKEWFNLKNKTIKQILSNKLINDLRTILLIHDKRFFTVLYDEDFLAQIFKEEEKKRFKEFILPTFQKDLHPNEWNKAKADKDDYIFKPTVLGKGIGIHYGKQLAQMEWNTLLDSNSNDAIIQPFIQQKKFSGNIGNEERLEDYFVGTLLYYNNKYYGVGLIRASSHPITNQGDDRKVAPVYINSNFVKQSFII